MTIGTGTRSNWYLYPVVALVIERQNVNAIILAGAEPVLVGLSHFGAKLLIQLLARTRPSVAVDPLEVLRHPADKGGLEDRAVTLTLILAEDRVRVAVDRFRIAREADEVVLAIPRYSVGFPDKPAAIEHPDRNGGSRLQQVAFVRQREPQIRVILFFERHGAFDRIVKLKRNGHARWSSLER